MRSSLFVPDSSSGRPFDLVRWFAALCFGTLAVTSIATAMLLSGFIEDRLLALDAQAARDFVQTVTRAENVEALALPAGAPVPPALAEFFSHVSQLPEVVRFNVYGRDHRMLWSSDASLIGRQFGENDELDEALKGEVVVKRGYASPGQHAKPEHVAFSEKVFFVESYIPILGADGGPPVAVVELYKLARTLERTLDDARLLVWVSALIGGAVLYFVLLGIVRRAARQIELQQQRLVEADMMATIGEMGGTVAHGIRNPLASIRSSAELALDDPECTWRDQARDIVGAADRIEDSIRKLLSFSRKPGEAPGPAQPLSVNQAVTDCVAELQREFGRRAAVPKVELDPADPRVTGDASMLREVFTSLIVNALEAMDDGGTVHIATRFEARRRRVIVTIHDSGQGMNAAELAQVMRPFHTTKSKGLGLGLPLAKRVAERHGGSLELASAPGRGTTVRVMLPAVR